MNTEFYKSYNNITQKYCFLLTPHTGVFIKISLIVVSLNVKKIRSRYIVSFTLVVSKIAHHILCQILQELLIDTTIIDNESSLIVVSLGRSCDILHEAICEILQQFCIKPYYFLIFLFQQQVGTCLKTAVIPESVVELGSLHVRHFPISFM